MIKTRETVINIGGPNLRINIVDNADDLYMNSIDQEEAPVWLDIWPSSIGLARWLWRNPLLEGKRIMELGAGLGLSGLVAALKGGRVLQTDYIQEAMNIARESAKLNNLVNIEQVTADWRNFTIEEKFDYIIGSDFLYLPNMHVYLKQIFENNLKPGGKIFIADPGRYDSKELLKEMAAEGWLVEEDLTIIEKDVHNHNIYVFQISK